MSLRKLTIGGVNGQGDDGQAEAQASRVPALHLEGLWLEDAGFAIGDQVRVEAVEAGCLLLTRVTEEDLDAQPLLPLVWIPAEQIAAVERVAAEAGRRQEPAHA
jgi:hypothetical protein